MISFRSVSLAILGLFFIGILVSSCSLFPTTPALSWSENQSHPIVQITNCCGFTPQLVPLNYIPDAQIWGDGRFVWVSPGPDGTRVVTETTLPDAQIEALLKRISATGFFQWRDEYADHSITDIPWQCINIELIAISKSVCEYYRGAPQAFHDLYDDLASGLNQTGTPYQPEHGYLTAFRMEGLGFNTTPLEGWNASDLGVNLSDAIDGLWIEGPALERAWEIVNGNHFANMVESNGSVYQLALQIPRLSMVDPENL